MMELDSLEGWIRRIVVNNAIDEFRKKKNDFFLMESIEKFQRDGRGGR